MSGLTPVDLKKEQDRNSHGWVYQDQGPNVCEPTILSGKGLLLNGTDFSIITNYTNNNKKNANYR